MSSFWETISITNVMAKSVKSGEALALSSTVTMSWGGGLDAAEGTVLENAKAAVTVAQ